VSRWRTEIIGDATLIQGDCREILPTLGKVDIVVTDPPYGVDYAHWDGEIPEWFDAARSISSAMAFTCGMENVRRYPEPDWIVCWAKPGSTRRNRTGGFNHWEPVLFYGERRIWTDFIYLPDCVNHAEKGVDHPCPKPVSLMGQLIEKLDGRSVCDPFMGSGTTGVAAIQLGRAFTGIEIEPAYFEIACRRAEEAWKQPRLFTERTPPPTQGALGL